LSRPLRLRAIGTLVLALALGAPACDGDFAPGAADAGAGGPPAPAAAFEPTSCGFESAPPGLDVTCGRVRVPEGRDDPATAMISVKVAVVRAKDAPSPTRTAIYLDGGAGGSSIANLIYYGAWTPSRALRALLVGRVLVAIDSRGTGGSHPRLDCPGLDVVPLPERPTESPLFSAEDVGRCRSRLVSEGVAPPAYGTEAAADDVASVRQALQLDGYDLVGSSHGARVALEVLRRHPQGVRAVVLDGLTPPDVNALAEEGASLERALGRAFAECAADPACQTRSPDPAAALAEVVARLQADPIEVSSHGGSATLDGRTMVQALATMLRDGHAADDLVKRIEEARAGNYDFVAAVLTSPRTPGAVGAFLSVACAEQMAGTSLEAIETAAMAQSPAVRGALSSRFVALACPPWAVPAAPERVRTPVTSGLPVLLLAGDRDPITPPAFARKAAVTLSRAQVLEFPKQGHQLLHLSCGASAAATFLDNPAAAPTAADCRAAP
jgi:pimeloyl-ACP methyl ester carboxylesterase